MQFNRPYGNFAQYNNGGYNHYNGGYNNRYNGAYNNRYNGSYQNSQPKKRSGSKNIVSKETGEVIGVWGWCIRKGDLFSISIIRYIENKCKKPGFASAFAEVINRRTGQKWKINDALLNANKGIGTVRAMNLTINPNKNYCGTFLRRK